MIASSTETAGIKCPGPSRTVLLRTAFRVLKMRCGASGEVRKKSENGWGPDMRLSFGDCVIDTETRILARCGQPVHLSPKAFALLQYLIEKRPRVLSKQELSDQLWPDVVVAAENLKNLVFEIRTALGADHGAIRTAQRFGYAFAAEVRSRLMSARLVGVEHTYPLHFGENVIGREAGCSVVLEATGVSRHHACITVTNESAFLEDLESKNGTWRNGERINCRIELHDSDVVRVGMTSLTFRASADANTTTAL